MDFAIVFDLFVTLDFNHLSIVKHEAVSRIGQVLFLDQHALESFRVETESGATLQALAMRIGVNILEIIIRIFRRNIGCL